MKLDVLVTSSYPELVTAVEELLPSGLDYFIPNAGIDAQTYKTFGNDLYVTLVNPFLFAMLLILYGGAFAETLTCSKWNSRPT